MQHRITRLHEKVKTYFETSQNSRYDAQLYLKKPKQIKYEEMSKHTKNQEEKRTKKYPNIQTVSNIQTYRKKEKHSKKFPNKKSTKKYKKVGRNIEMAEEEEACAGQIFAPHFSQDQLGSFRLGT